MTTQEQGQADEKDPRLDDVVESVTTTRDDVDETEVRYRAERVLDDLSGAEVQAFITPLATNRVRKEVIGDHGRGEEVSDDAARRAAGVGDEDGPAARGGADQG